MNWIDLIIGLLLVYTFYRGFTNGLVLELASLLALVLGIFAAYNYSDIVAIYIKEWVDWSETALLSISFILTFLIVVIVINLLGRIISNIIGMIALGLINKIAGGIFGLIKISLIIGLIFLLADAIEEYVNIFEYQVVQSSFILNFYEDNVLDLFPQIIETVEDNIPKKTAS